MTFYLLHLKNYPIYKQLQLEEALLRSDTRNFCILNEGSPPAIVMGISGQLEKFVDSKKQTEKPLPIIKRFSGGGTVVVDENTLFVSFICQKQTHPFPPYPEQLLRFGESIYQNAWKIPAFQLKENDYAIGERKCGGNAQYLRKDRWLQHTTFLWDYKKEQMDYLLHPEKTPKYREGRSHEEFICRLSNYYSNKQDLFTQLKRELSIRFSTQEISLQEALPISLLPHRKSTTIFVEN